MISRFRRRCHLGHRLRTEYQVMRNRRSIIQGTLQPGRVRVDIDSLISPLRYDIFLRMGCFRFHAARRVKFARRFDDYIAEAEQLPYYLWFKYILCKRVWPHLLESPDDLHAAYRHRMRQLAGLYDSMQSRGYDHRLPIVLSATTKVLATSTGKTVIRDFYAANGCHRLALLRLWGRRVLLPGQYCVRHVDQLAPADHTAMLLPHVNPTAAEYFSFLSGGYGGLPCTSEAALINHVAHAMPDRLDELRDVIKIDRRWLGRENVQSETPFS